MEQNLKEISQTYGQALWIVSSIFFAIGIARLIYVLKTKNDRNLLWKVKADWLVICIKSLFIIGLFAFLADIPVWFITVAQFRPVAPAGPHLVFIIVMFYICIQELILSFTVSNSLINGFVKKMLFFLISVFCSASFLLAAFIVPGTYSYPPLADCVVLDLPVKGNWMALHAGKEKWVNYHSNYPPQMYAMDVVKIDEEGHFFSNNGTDSSDYFSFKDSVFAPCNGIVYKTVNGFNTQLVHKGEDTINPAGNQIEIQLAPKQFLFLAHLLNGSLQVKEGDTIKAGQFLALAGNSGNTTFPHLHMHLQDKPILNDSTTIGLPYRFANINRKRFVFWHQEENAFLIRNDKFSNK